MNYRLADSKDLELLAGMNAQLIEDEGHQNEMGIRELEARMKSWLENIYEAAIIEDGDEDVGYVLYRLTDDGWEGVFGGIYIRHFFIVRHRRREGLGRAAFELLRSACWKKGCRITLETLLDNPDAQAFWKSLGFREYCIAYELYEK